MHVYLQPKPILDKRNVYKRGDICVIRAGLEVLRPRQIDAVVSLAQQVVMRLQAVRRQLCVAIGSGVEEVGSDPGALWAWGRRDIKVCPNAWAVLADPDIRLGLVAVVKGALACRPGIGDCGSRVDDGRFGAGPLATHIVFVFGLVLNAVDRNPCQSNSARIQQSIEVGIPAVDNVAIGSIGNLTRFPEAGVHRLHSRDSVDIGVGLISHLVEGNRWLSCQNLEPTASHVVVGYPGICRGSPILGRIRDHWW